MKMERVRFVLEKQDQKRIENIAFGLASAKGSCTIILGSRILTGKKTMVRATFRQNEDRRNRIEKKSFHIRGFGNLEKGEKKVDSDWPVRGMRAWRIRSSFTSVGARSGACLGPFAPVRTRTGTLAARSRGSEVGQGKLFI